jgi:hypothetical protein
VGDPRLFLATIDPGSSPSRRIEAAAERFVDALVDQVAQRHGLVESHVLPHAIVDHDLVVDGAADQREQRGDRRQAEVDAGQSEEPDHLGQVEHEGDDGPDRERPFEPDPDVDQHRHAARVPAERLCARAGTQGRRAVPFQCCASRFSRWVPGLVPLAQRRSLHSPGTRRDYEADARRGQMLS